MINVVVLNWYNLFEIHVHKWLIMKTVQLLLTYNLVKGEKGIWVVYVLLNTMLNIMNVISLTSLTDQHLQLAVGEVNHLMPRLLKKMWYLIRRGLMSIKCMFMPAWIQMLMYKSTRLLFSIWSNSWPCNKCTVEAVWNFSV